MFISVIIPLKINWLPVYRCSRQIKVGSRVRVEFAHKLYVGVVAECDVACELPEAQVLEVAEIADGLPEVSANELKLWQFVSEYYMCSIGEVYRAAYPKERVQDEEALCRRAARLAERQRVANEKLREKLNRKLERLLRRKEKAADNEKLGYEIEAVLMQLAELSGAVGEAGSGASEASDVRAGAGVSGAEAGVSGAERSAGAAGTVQVIEGPCRTRTYRELIKEEFASASGQVLVLAPSIAECELLRRELAGEAILPCYNTETGIATRREIIAAARSGKSCVIVSTRAGIWLPFSNLRLIIVERENDPYYKVQEPAPRLNARDTAIMLGQIHHSSVVLGGDALSLETSLNLACGKYLPLRTATLKSDLTPESADGRSSLNADSFSSRNSNKDRFAELLNAIDPRDLLDLQSSGPRIIDISQERRKKGMAGAISRIVLRTISRLSEVQKRHGAGGTDSSTDPLQFILIRGWENEPELQATLERELPENLRKNVTIKSFAEFKRSPSLPSFCVIVVLQADALVSREDFRADEKAVQLVAELNARCCKLIVQTEIPERFGSTRSTADLLLERKSFNLPPYSRLIDIRISGRISAATNAATNSLTARVLATGLPSNGVTASGLAAALPSNGASTGAQSSALPSNGVSTGAQSSALPSNGATASGLETGLPNNGVSTGGLATGLPSNGVEARIDRLRNRLTSQFGRCDCLSPAPGTITLRITLPRDKQLTNNKLQLARILQDAERQFGRTLRIIPDVDPL